MVTPNTRATDSDRNGTCQVLDAALSDGQLSMEEHRQRVSAATNAATLGELQSLVSDLQIHSAPDQLATVKSHGGSRGIRIAVIVVLVLLGAGVVWGLFGRDASSSRTASTSSATANANAPAAVTTGTTPPQAPTDMLTLGGLTGLVAQIGQKFGDTMGYQLTVFPDQADLARPDSVNAHKTVLFHYSKLGWINLGPSPIPPDATVGDLSKFSAQEVIGVLRGAPQALHVNNATNTYLIIESEKDGSLSLRIYLSDGVNTGYMELAPDGTVEQIHPARS